MEKRRQESDVWKTGEETVSEQKYVDKSVDKKNEKKEKTERERERGTAQERRVELLKRKSWRNEGLREEKTK